MKKQERQKVLEMCEQAWKTEGRIPRKIVHESLFKLPNRSLVYQFLGEVNLWWSTLTDPPRNYPGARESLKAFPTFRRLIRETERLKD